MAATKERQSRMAVSSLHQQPKKGGAGGSYTWGSAADVTDYEPVGVTTSTVTVSMAPSPVTVVGTPIAASPTTSINIQDKASFPVLGSPTAAPVVRSWGPSMAAAAAPVVRMTAPAAMATTAPAGTAQLSEGALRPGALQVVDQQHPRNLFAKKAYNKPNGEVVVQQATAQAPAQNATTSQVIDWSKLSPGSLQQILKQTNPAHLGPYATKPADPVPLDVLRVRTEAVKQAQLSQMPTAQKAAYAPKPVIIQQPQKR